MREANRQRERMAEKERDDSSSKIVVIVVLCFDEPGQGAHSETLMSLVGARTGI